jgi:hypothetical protein
MALDYSKRSRSTQPDILVAFRDRLISAVPGCTDLTCFISDQPIPAMIPGGGSCVTVSIGEGVFDQQLFTGGGAATLCEEFQVVITAMTQVVLDRIPQAERALLEDDRGLLVKWKVALLRALLLEDYTLGLDSKPWEPAIDDQPLCRELIRPVHSSAPGDIPNKPGWIGFQLTFSTSFDWDLA